MARKPDPEVVALLESYLKEARAGRIQNIYIVADDEEGEYQDAFQTDDLNLLIYETNQLSLKTRIEAGRDEGDDEYEIYIEEFSQGADDDCH